MSHLSYRCNLALFALWISVPLCPAQTPPASESSDYENRLYLDPTLLGSAQTAGAAFFGGHVSHPGAPQIPTDGLNLLVNSAFGQPVASAGVPSTFLCDQVTSYHLWLQQFFPENVYLDRSQALTQWGFGAQPAGDRVPNLVKYALGLAPTSPVTNALIHVWAAPVLGTNHFFISYTRRSNDPNLGFGFSSSTNLPQWESSAPGLVLVGVTPTSPSQEAATYMDSSPLSSAIFRFYLPTVSYLATSPPSVTLTSSAPYAVYNGGVVSNSITFAAQATDASGCVILLEFFINGVLVGSGSSFTWTPTSIGNYDITVRAVNNFGMASLSPAIHFGIDHDSDGDGIPDFIDPFPSQANRPPAILSLFLSSFANFHSSGSVSLSVNASDPDGDPINYQLLVGGTTVTPLQSPNLLAWQPSPADFGPRTLTARATDRWGLAANQARTIYVFRTPPTP